MDETAPWRLEIDDVIISSLPRVFPRRVLAKICHIEHVLMVTAASKEYRYVVLTDNSFYIFTRDALLKGTKKRGTHPAPPCSTPPRFLLSSSDGGRLVFGKSRRLAGDSNSLSASRRRCAHAATQLRIALK